VSPKEWKGKNTLMLIYDGIYRWKGFGGKFQLARGQCKLRIHDLAKDNPKEMILLKPIIVIVTDVPREKISDVTVKSCASHIATLVTADFNIDFARMLWVEYYPRKTYGQDDSKVIEEMIESVEFDWHDGKAVMPKWRTVKPPLDAIIRKLL
jgi:hypothetical protein